MVQSQGNSMNHWKNLLLNNKHTLIIMLRHITNMQLFTREPIISQTTFTWSPAKHYLNETLELQE